MTWSSNGLQYTYTETTEGGGTITYTDTYNTAYAAPGSKITKTTWSDGTNSSTIEWAASTETFDFNGDKTVASDATETGKSVFKESGTSSWTYVDDNDQTQTSTLTFEHYFDYNSATGETSWSHLGGFETDENGVTTYYTANFVAAYEKRSLSSVTDQIDSGDGIEYDLYTTPKYVDETTTGWNGQDVVTRTYYNATTEEEVGRAITTIDSWTEGSATVTATNTSYEDENGNWLGSEWLDSNGNQGWFYSTEVSTVDEPAHLSLDGDSNLGESSGSDVTFSYTDAAGDAQTTIIVEKGEDTWSYTDISGATVTETRSYTHYYDTDYNHKGGLEVQDGETIKYDANWTFAGVTKDVTNLSVLSDTDSIAYKLFGAAKYDTETWLGWNGLEESETVYYSNDAAGTKLGSSFTMNNSWTTPDGQTVTSSNTSYNDADFNYLGNEWVEGSNGGWNFEKTLTSGFAEPTGVDLDGDGTAAEANITTVKVGSNDITISASYSANTSGSVVVREGQDKFSFTDMAGNTVTEDIVYKHYYAVDGNGHYDWTNDHLGGYEIRNGETVIYEAGFQQGAKTRDVSSITDALTSSDGIAYELYGTAKYIAEDRVGWNGETETETTYYDSSGAELGYSMSNINKWTDFFSGSEVTSTNTGYHNAAGDFLGSEWSDSNGNQGWFYSTEVSTVDEPAHLSLDGDSNLGESSGSDVTFSYTDAAGDAQTTIIVEKGEDTWSYTDISGATVTETRSYTHYYDTDYNHKGGLEVQDGETIKYDANWTFAGVTKDVTNLSVLSDTDSIAYKLFGAAKYDTETWLGWNGLEESETTYYSNDAAGTKLGSSFTMNNSWTTPDGQTVTSSNTSYNDADFNYLGNEWVEGSNGGWNFEKTLTSGFAEPTGVDLDGDGTAAEANITTVKVGSNDITISASYSANTSGSVVVREGQDKFSFTDMAGNTVTEDIVYKHYYAVDGNGHYDWTNDHLGGYEIRNGETIIYEAGFQQGAKTRDVSSITDALTSSDGIAYELYGTAKYIAEDRVGWNGETETETTYYDSSGAELGYSMSNINKWTDFFSGLEVTSTNTGYHNAAGDFLGSESSESNGNQGWFYSTEVSTVDEPAHLSLDGDSNLGESSGSDVTFSYTDAAGDAQTTIIVEKGEDTWSYTDISGATVTETRSYTHYYDTDYNHKGGLEVQDGETIKYDANWTFAGVTKDVTNLSVLSDTDSIAYKLFGAAKYDTETWLGWNGLEESETVYYSNDAAGTKLGSSFTMNNSWTTPDGQTVTSSNTSYNDADFNYLGNEWVEGSNGGWNFEKTLTSGFAEPTGVDLDGDGTAAEANITTVKVGSNDITISASYSANTSGSVVVREGQDKFSFTDMAGNTVTEDIVYKHYYAVDGNGHYDWTNDHLGGYEIRNGETVIYEAGFQQGAKTRDVSSITDALTSSDGIAYELYGTAKYIAEDRVGWNGETETETTYYDSSGAELGYSMSNINKWTDFFSGLEVTSTNTGYHNAAGDFLGSESSESNGNQGWFYSTEVSTVDEPAHLSLDGDSNLGESSGSDVTFSYTDAAGDAQTTIIVEKGEDTWSYTDISGATVTETRSYTHYYDTDYNHKGGLEVQDGETIKYDANWTFAGVTKDVTNLSVLSDTDSIAYKLFGAAKYDTETWLGWNGLEESETVYYSNDAAGTKLGSSFTMNNSWTTPDGQTVTSSNTSYNDADFNYLGNEWVEGSNGGWNFEKTLTSGFAEPTGVDLDGDGTAAEANITTVKVGSNDITISASYSANTSGSVVVREGQDKFSFTDMAGNTVTEDIVYKHYYAVDGNGHYDWTNDHLGGYEIRNGETVIYEAGMVAGAKSKDVSGQPLLTADVDSIAFSAFDAGSYTQGVTYESVVLTGWNGFDEIETTYYDKELGTEIGKSFSNKSEFTNWDGTYIVSESTNYQNVNGDPIANTFTDKDNLGNILSSRTSVENLQTLTSEPAWLDLNDNATDGESGVSIEVIVETGSETFSFRDGATLRTETRDFTHYFDKDTREHLGGSEVQAGVTTKFGANWTPLGTQKSSESIAALPSLVDYATDGLAFTFYGQAKYEISSFGNSTKTTFYLDDGTKIGESIESSFTLQKDGQEATETRIDYRGSSDQFLGSEMSDTLGNSERDITYTQTLTSEPTYLDLNANGTFNEAISGGRSVRTEELTRTDGGQTSSTIEYFDVSTGAFLGGLSTANGYTSVLGGTGVPTGDIYDSLGNLLTVSGILDFANWNNPSAIDLNQKYIEILSAVTGPGGPQNIYDGTNLIGIEFNAGNASLQYFGALSEIAGSMSPGSMSGSINSVVIKENGNVIAQSGTVNIPLELVEVIHTSVEAGNQAPFSVIYDAGLDMINISNSTLSDMETYKLQVQLEDDSGNVLNVSPIFQPKFDGLGHPIQGEFEIPKVDLKAAIDAAISYSDPAIWNASTVITNVKVYEDTNFSFSFDGTDNGGNLGWNIFDTGGISPVVGADYTLGTSDNIQSVINSAADLNNDGEIVIALTAGRYDQNFTIDKDVSIWGSAKGLAISQDGADTEDTKVDEVSEVIFDLSDGGRGVGETWINGTVTVAHDGVTMDGLRLHNYHGPLKFEGTDIDNFTLKHSYVTGFNAPDAFKYIDTDGVKSTGWLLDGNLIGGVSGGVGGSLYLTGMENVVVSDNVFWRPGAAHMYIEDVTNADFIDNFYLQGLHADGANQDGLYSQLAAHSTWGYVGFSGNNFGTTGYGPNGYGPYGYGPNGYGPNGYGPNGYGPNGYGPNGYGPNGYGPSGYGPNGYGPNGYGPNGYGPDGYSSLTSVTNNELDYYGRNYVVEVKGVTDQVTFDGNTAKFNSGGIQFWDEGDTANYFTNTLIQDNTFTDFYNADPNGILATVESRHKSGLVGGVVVSLEDGSASEDLVIQNNSFVGSISEIYNEDDIDALILIQGEMNSVYVSGNVLEWRGDEVSDTYTSLPNDQVYTQGIYLLGDVGGSGSGVGIALQDNVFDTDISAANYISNAIVVDGRDFSSEGFGQFSSVVEINDSVSPYSFDDLFGNYLVSTQDDFNHVVVIDLANSAVLQGYDIITPPDLTA